ncbi:hypothetical protein EW146_g6595 [Bondarzewia mesenterica]|uniref:Cytochrome P450 n=1 Tax=Bondarzewia mesenterica TaxID=1095465 RepID=A0A4V6S1E0_9AGAM|nr:hypothetical protein EW146_g6595 [Bondarzewia mesenterica]
MNDNISPLLAAGLIGLSAFLYSRLGKKRAPAPLPPGPKGLPLLANIADLPQFQPWVTFAKWGETYGAHVHRSLPLLHSPLSNCQSELHTGGIVHVSALGKSIIVLNDAQYAIDMLDKKSRLYSDRPTLVMAGRLVGWDEGPALIPFCNTWSEYRRLFAHFMGTRSKIDAFVDVLEEETHAYLRRILADPGAWVKHSHKLAGAIVLTLAYGYKATDEDDRLVNLVNEAMDQFSETTATNAFAVDIFPILRYVPEWFPGAAWKKKVAKYRTTLQDMLNLPYDWVKQQMAAGTARPCFISNYLGNKQVTPEEEHILKWAAAGIYSGGADTTVAGIESFFLAMTFHTSEQQKAQAELGAVIGTDRLPTLADRARLPYFEALFTEVLRTYTFGPIGPSFLPHLDFRRTSSHNFSLLPSFNFLACEQELTDYCILTGLPHVVQEDDVHNGYFIPKGSTIITNIWQFFKDPTTYADPEVFSPERFMASEGHAKERDPREYLFGFGRRICPGIHLADASMWLACASVLAAFDIRPYMKDGKPVLPSGKYMDGSISVNFQQTGKEHGRQQQRLEDSLSEQAAQSRVDAGVHSTAAEFRGSPTSLDDDAPAPTAHRPPPLTLSSLSPCPADADAICPPPMSMPYLPSAPHVGRRR